MIHCRFENGNEASLRHVVMDAVCVQDGKILMVKRSENVTQGGKYALPGGFLERDETVEQGLLRELKEETGYDGKIIKLLRIVDKPDRGDDRQNVSFLYLAEPLAKTGEADDESNGVFWFELDNLPPEEQIAFDHFELIHNYLETNI